mgnify:CR=1 FL=1
MRTISLTLDDEVLRRAEELARQSGITLALVFARAVNRLARERNDAAPPLSASEMAELKGIIHLTEQDEARGYRAIVAEERAKKYSV